MFSLMLVDDDPLILRHLARLLESADYSITTFTDPRTALTSCDTTHYDLVLSDNIMPGMRGLELLRAIQNKQPAMRRILLSAYSDFRELVDAFNAGVVHKFVIKPLDNELLFELVNQQLHRRRKDAPLGKKQVITVHEPGTYTDFHGIITCDPEMLRQINFIRKVVNAEAPFFIHGETGTGKELVARAIHSESRRRDGPFVALNCANLTENLLESQLFGHRKGAFTGANSDQKGLLQAANGGTLFLDEVIELPLGLQAKLLRVLQEREFTPLGETLPRKFDAQIVAAAAKTLEQAADEGSFRQDLRFRLEVMPIRLPPLRERKADLLLLFDLFLARELQRQGVQIEAIEPAVYQAITNYAWQGNIRELLNVCVYVAAVVSATENIVGIECFPMNFMKFFDSASVAVVDTPQVAATAEPAIKPNPKLPDISLALHTARGNKSEAARILGISRMTLWRKIREFGLTEKS